MKHLLVIFLSLLSAFSLPAQQPDSSRLFTLSAKLQEYYEALKHESLDVQKQECDFLISSATDSIVRQHIALDIYNHYIGSPVMGAENVAVHVFDRWFDTGAVRMKSDSDFIAAQVYADFNRSSLIGAKAPQFRMETPDGSAIELFGDNDMTEAFRVLYFYDTDCAKCKFETILLNELFAAKDYPVEFYAIYSGDDRQGWDAYRSERLSIDKAVHLWDPEFDSDFQRKYGVLQTPRLFLISPDGTIVGRGLDAAALETLLESISPAKALIYGSAESEALFDGIFSMSDGRPSVKEVMGIADYISDRTIGLRDTLMFRQMAGDFLYYLATRSGEAFKEGLKYHIDRNISSSDVWKSSDDSLKVIGFAQIMDDLLSKSAPGTRISSIKVPGELYTWKGSRNVTRKLDRLKGKLNIIIFYTEGCEVCAAEKAAALKLVSASNDRSLSKQDRKQSRYTDVFMVNIDSLMMSDPSLASRLMDSFDLSSLPFIIQTDSHGTILRRYLSLL